MPLLPSRPVFPRAPGIGTGALLAVALLLASTASWGATPKVFPPPGPTAWAPTGCREVPPVDAVLGPRTAWRNLHADAQGSDELDLALTPMFAEGWVAESNTFNATGPVFDADGNLYFSPLYPHENVVLISVEPTGGTRRWAISGTGAIPGASSPLVLEDPVSPGDQVVYVAVYDRAVAVHTDGTVVWDVPTGLTLPVDPSSLLVFGLQYVPALDALVGLSVDGFLFVLDRATGAPLLGAPHELPGEPSPQGDPIGTPTIIEAVKAELAPLMDLPADADSLFGVLLGNGVEVSNHFSVDARTGRVWVASTAPDAEDGTVDGVSELGALYGLDLVPNGGGFQVQEACHRYFIGGSASTPALRADGGRVYVADNEGRMIAVDDSCADQWILDLGEQIIGSIAVASDNGELYASTIGAIRQVIDEGNGATVAWTATPDVFDLGFLETTGNVNLVGIGANGVWFQYGAGRNASAPSIVGVGVLDRETGGVRYFTGGFDESVAVMSTGPDGALYLGNSPFRRAIARAIFPLVTPPLVGGVRQYLSERLDLLIDDAVCAAADRVSNAAAVSGSCADSALADIGQIEALIAQTRGAAPRAVAVGDLDPADWATIDGWLALAEPHLQLPTLSQAVAPLEAACLRSTLSEPQGVPALGPGGLGLLVGTLGALGAARLIGRSPKP